MTNFYWKILTPYAALILFGLGFALSLPHEIQYQDAYAGAHKESADIPLEGIATAVIAIFAVFQYFEFRKSSERQLRAYLNIEEGGVSSFRIRITAKNFGQTPAYEVSHWVDAVLSDPGAVPAFEKRNGAINSEQIVLAPTGEFQMQPVIRDVRAPNDNLIVRPKGHIYAFGEITYRDAFGEARYTKFFLASESREGAFSNEGPHNTAT